MSCRRAFDIDLADFLSEPGRDEFADFREHYPLCPDCAAEVRAWTDLHVLLQSRVPGSNGGHPEPEMLLRYEQRDARLAAASVEELESHLARCSSCRDELSALRQFDFSALASEAPRGPTVRDRLATFVDGLRALFVHPAFAYALVLVLLYPAAMSYFSGTGAPELFPMRAADEKLQAQSRVLLEEAEPKDAGQALSAAPTEARANVVRKERPLRAPAETVHGARGKAEGVRAEAPPRESESPAARSQPARLRQASERKRAEADLPAPGVFAYEAAPSPPQTGVAGEAAPDRPEADAYEAPQLGRRRSAVMSRRAGDDVPPWILRVRVPEEVRRSPRFEVRIVHPDGRRELRQQFVSSEAGEEIEIALPFNWRPTDDNRIEFRAILD